MPSKKGKKGQIDKYIELHNILVRSASNLIEKGVKVAEIRTIFKKDT